MPTEPFSLQCLCRCEPMQNHIGRNSSVYTSVIIGVNHLWFSHLEKDLLKKWEHVEPTTGWFILVAEPPSSRLQMLPIVKIITCHPQWLGTRPKRSMSRRLIGHPQQPTGISDHGHGHALAKAKTSWLLCSLPVAKSTNGFSYHSLHHIMK